VRFASYNIQYGVGLDGKFNPERIARNLEGADIIALQEVTRGSPANGGADLVEIFANHFPEHHYVFGPACDLHASSALIKGRRVDKRHQIGNMILSRWPILTNRLLLLPRTRTFEKLNIQRGATEAVIDTPIGPLRVYSVHLDHVSPDERIAQIRFLKDRVINFAAEGGALTGAHEIPNLPQPPLPEDYILLGDFNMQPESPEYVEMVGTIDTYYGRTARHDAPIDALARLGQLTPGCYSWEETGRPDKRLHLDYGFLSGSLAHRLKAAHVDIHAVGSDHFPVWVELD
jgi:endonuclease/exonuclease/phosphatase family metal-dependent hydrolase